MDPLAERFLRFRGCGDVAALGEVFDVAAPRLLVLAMHLCGNAADAEDVVQETFVLAMRKADAFVAGQRLEPWLAGILAGEARNLVRKRQRRHGEPLPEVASAEGGPVPAAERKELVAQLRAHVERLPHEQRQALLLQLEHGLTPAEIAEVLAVAPGTVRMRLHRGLQALRRLLPAALAMWLVGALPSRGLAAVRASVLREAARVRSAAAASGAAMVIGGAMATKVVVALMSLGLVAALLWSVPGETVAPPGHENASDAPSTTMAAASDAAAANAATQRRVPVDGSRPTPSGALLVRARFDDDGRPVVDLPVRMRADAPCTRTDEQGEVRFADVPPGAPRLWLGPPPKAATVANEPTIVAGRQATEELRVPQGGVVHGLVVDELEQPIAGAVVWIGGTGDDPELRRHAATTGSDGTFEVGFAKWETDVAVTAPGFCYGWSQPTYEESGSTLRRFVMQRGGGAVHGRVIDEAGNALADVTLALGRHDTAGGRALDGSMLFPPLPRLTTADSSGAFRFEDVAPGAWWVSLAGTPFGLGEQAVTVVAHAATDTVVTAPARATVTGTVRDRDDAPVPAVAVSLRRTDAATTWTASDAAGRFTLSCWPGAWRLRAGTGKDGSATVDVQLRAGLELHQDLTWTEAHDAEGADAKQAPLATVAGRVLAPGGLARHARVELRDDDHDVIGEVACRDDGSFTLAGVPVGRFTVVARADDAAPATAPVEVTAAEARLDVGTLALGVAGAVELTVRRSDGSAWRGPYPMLSVDPIAGGRRSWVRFDEAIGRVGSLAPGRYRLFCEELDLIVPPTELAVRAGETTRATIAIGIGRTCTLTFTPPADVAFDAGDRLHVRLLDATGTLVRERELRRPPRSRPRDYTWEPTLPPNPYTVEAHTDGGLRFEGAFSVPEAPERCVVDVPCVGR